MILTALLSAAALSQAEPPADPLVFDLRCLILASQLGEESEGEMRSNALLMATFFFGRVDTHLPEAQLEARLMQEALALQSQDFQAEIAACGAFMTERGQVLTQAGDRMQAAEQAGRR